ncbi:hypothetical protein QR680_016601 [Steinernema hermaphroditum]|uniref:Tyrosine-protein kinase n=1 Tax=Steinernema hermaphroditum TaxID=289476 RepID=A0AA39HDP0_9BILA|nr:hypothetical protein QR680_016601 [Steinernema hermaphroditum]
MTGLRQGAHTDLDVWHGMLPNEDTAALLKKDGDFLLRGVEVDDVVNIFISIRWGRTILNAAIAQCPSGGFDFQGSYFETVRDVVDFYQVRKRPLSISGQAATLDTPIRRKPWELRHRMVKLGKELGSGSYGTVYKGTLTLDRQKPIEVAVKALTEMNNEALNALWKEARVMQKYDHPNVVKLYGVANDFTPCYLVMEFVAGGSVDSYLTKKNTKVGVKSRVQILLDAAMGLEYMHSKGTIHRDVAARNLLIDKVVKVSDFGLARRTTKYKIDPNKPMNLRWLAPEVYETAVVNKQTDVYAFGVTMWECFTVPYSIPYADWKPNKVYDKVINKGYRLEAPKLMPKMMNDLMRECLGEESERPTFKSIVVNLRSYLTAKAIHEGGGLI